MARSRKRSINLALQGGGSHGAFGWGVLDRLLEDDDLSYDGICGTSAGAMNAAVLAYGLAAGGREAARAKLAEFWKAVSDAALWSPLQSPAWANSGSAGSLDNSPMYWALDMMSRLLSPYELNPGNHHPLRQVLNKVVDFEFLRAAGGAKLSTCASNVLTGRLRVFKQNETRVETVLASACLPFMFQAVEVDGEFFWDGGYMGNPPLFPLVYDCASPDIVLVMINPIEIAEVPKTAREILDRINTLSFNSSLMREMRAVDFVTKLIDRGFDDGGKLKRKFIHCIDAESAMRELSASSKLNAQWPFLLQLRDLGWKAADEFLSGHRAKLGHSSSVSLSEKFL